MCDILADAVKCGAPSGILEPFSLPFLMPVHAKHAFLASSPFWTHPSLLSTGVLEYMYARRGKICKSRARSRGHPALSRSRLWRNMQYDVASQCRAFLVSGSEYADPTLLNLPPKSLTMAQLSKLKGLPGTRCLK